MVEVMSRKQALFFVKKQLLKGHSEDIIRNGLAKNGYSDDEIAEVFEKVLLSGRDEKMKNEEQNMKNQSDANLIGNSFTKIMEIIIVYGVPVFLLVFGAGYVYQQISIDIAVGLRSLAAVILPIVITMGFRNTPIRANAIEFLTEQKIVSFVITFVLTFSATAIAMFYRHQSGNIIPVGELVFSSTLALMIFGSDNSGRSSFLHVGAVSGFLTYVILFGLAL